MAPFAIPAVTSGRLRAFRVTDFSGGLDVMTSPTKLADLGHRNRWLTVAKNVVFETDGSVAKRWGMIEKGNGTVLSTAISGGIEWRPSTAPASQTDVVATQDGTVYSVTNSGYTSIKTGLTSVRNYSFAIYNDILHVANGTDAPQQWDGTTWAALGGSSPATASVFVAHGNRMFALAKAVPSRLYWSKLNASTDWSGTTDAGFLDVNPNDGGVLTTLVPGVQELVLGKTWRPYRLQGIGPTTGYTVVDHLMPADGSIGPTSMQAAVYAANDVWYASQSGIHRLSATQQYGDLKNSFISHRVEPYFRRNTTYSPYDTISFQGYSGFADSPTLSYDSANGLLLHGARYSSVTNACDRVLVYNIALDAFSEWRIASGGTAGEITTPFWESQNNSTHMAELRCGLYSSASGKGMLVALRRDQTSDLTLTSGSLASAGIVAQVRHATNLGAAGMEKVPRYIYFYFSEQSSSTTMTLNLYADFKTTAAFTTTFDIASATAESIIVKRVDVGGFTCEYLEVDLQNSTAGRTFTLYGYEVHWRPRRDVGRAE